ncbi:MAG: hypothetical protein JWO98_1845 [Frankiales bacterium]|nr:hypothetical protein [Frankiales bacterium]
MTDTMSTGTGRTPVGALTVAVVGTGSVGGTLGRAFARAGHTVVFGSPGSSRNTPGRSPDG